MILRLHRYASKCLCCEIAQSEYPPPGPAEWLHIQSRQCLSPNVLSQKAGNTRQWHVQICVIIVIDMARDFGEFGSVARAGDWDELETGAKKKGSTIETAVLKET
jgi:hypothetical protein